MGINILIGTAYTLQKQKGCCRAISVAQQCAYKQVITFLDHYRSPICDIMTSLPR